MKWIRIRLNVVDPGGSGSETLLFILPCTRNQMGELTKLWQSFEELGEHVDVNAWQRVTRALEVDHEYRIVLEATVGRVGEGDIGIDDLSLTPGCK